MLIHLQYNKKYSFIHNLTMFLFTLPLKWLDTPKFYVFSFILMTTKMKVSYYEENKNSAI